MAAFERTGNCSRCGAEFSFLDNRVNHTDDCPWNPANAGEQAAEAADDQRPVASNIASLTLARADRGTKPREHRAEDALDLARAWIEESGLEQPNHIIVFIGRTNGDNSSGTKYFQTGSFSPHAQVGLVYEGLDMIRESGK